MITGISGFGFFAPEMAVSWRISVYQKKLAETPIFIVFFGVRTFWAKVSKKDILDTHQKRDKIDW